MSRAASSARRQAPGLVVLVDPSPVDSARIEALLSAGNVIILAPNQELARLWLPDPLWYLGKRRPSHVVVRFGRLEIDLTKHEGKWKDRVLDLTEHELQILAMLAEDPTRAWTFGELLARVWGESYSSDLAALRSAVKRLRKKLARHGVELAVDSVRGIGFRLRYKRRLRRRG